MIAVFSDEDTNLCAKLHANNPILLRAFGDSRDKVRGKSKL